MTTDVRSTVREFITAHVRDVDLDDDHDIFETGSVSSLFAVQLVVWVERTFGVEARPADLDMDNFRTVDHITAFVEARLGAAAAA